MTYKKVDLRNVLPGSPASNIGSQKKTPGRFVVHYSGPDFEGWDIYDQLRHGQRTVQSVLESETHSHMAPGRFSPGFSVNGLQYHYTVWEDTVYQCRNDDARLWHCGDGTSTNSYNYSALAVHVPTTKGFPVSARTIQTLAEFILDRLKASGTTSRASVKGHLEVGATECPGPLMNQFILPFRAGKIPADDVAPGGDGDHSNIPVDSMMSRWEFGQVSIDRIVAFNKPITITYDGDPIYTFTPNGMDRSTVPDWSRWQFVTANLQDIPPNMDVTYAGKKFGVLRAVAGNVPATDTYISRPLNYLMATRGGKYTPWFSGHFKEGVPAWVANAAPPSASIVKREGAFCAALPNLACRVNGLKIFFDTDWWAGGVAWWGQRIVRQGIAKPFSLSRQYPPGTLFLTPYTGAALSQQGHVALLLKGRTLIQSDFGLGINSSRTLDSTYANVSKFKYYVLPEDWLREKGTTT